MERSKRSWACIIDSASNANHPRGSQTGGTPLSVARQIANAWAVSATSWTRKISAPRAAAAKAKANDPGKRRDAGNASGACGLAILAIEDLRDRPATTGQPSA